jgi:histone-lysine N-methyltransferase SETD2
MVCDCFLTEEEFQRGELGCGEDCLNRLLMIEWLVLNDICGSKTVQYLFIYLLFQRFKMRCWQ